MSDLLIRDFSTPSKCMECEWRDAEACGECELMIGNPFPTFEEQFAHCPFQVIGKRHVLVPVPEHGRLIDADEFLKRAIGTKCFRRDYALMLEELVGESATILEAEEDET